MDTLLKTSSYLLTNKLKHESCDIKLCIYFSISDPKNPLEFGLITDPTLCTELDSDIESGSIFYLAALNKTRVGI